MNQASYIIIGLLVFLSVEFLSINVGNAIGSGPGEIGIVVSAISILCSIVVICTLIIVDTIKNNNHEK
ncbi:hypothetical protein [Crassaminicella profunda]|uniref:hypothetical protein n=1 Tax=Crassaminicella profunda TaxID=1286698 RepID=UPI001CA7800B|nr:hypothetical protein [Crassaminicella profunda]QZY53773.1 hypothetical protein K7H06_11955 [Crassaminicella profunda]